MDVNTPAVVDGLEPPSETAEPGEPGLPDARARARVGGWVTGRVWAGVDVTSACHIQPNVCERGVGGGGGG